VIFISCSLAKFYSFCFDKTATDFDGNSIWAWFLLPKQKAENINGLVRYTV